jgi:hypothetical protein
LFIVGRVIGRATQMICRLHKNSNKTELGLFI